MTFKPGSGVVYRRDDGFVKYYVRGRPVLLFPPAEQLDQYDVSSTLSPPNKRLQVQWVYGYRGKDCRHNVYRLCSGEIVYFVAGTAVLYHLQTRVQRHYVQHTDDIKCIAVHPDGATVATGQCAGTGSDSQPQVHVWSSVDLRTLHVLGVGFFDRSVCCLSFSTADDGSRLCCIDEGKDILLSVWDWQGNKKLADIKASVDTVVHVMWHPQDAGSIVTCGRLHVSFWQIDAAGDAVTLRRRQGVFGAYHRPKYVTALAFTGSGDLVTGDTDGRLLVWKRGTTRVHRCLKPQHKGAIFSLLLQDSGMMLSGGKDGSIVDWNVELTTTVRQMQLPEEYGGVRMLCAGEDSDQLVVGTTRNALLESCWGDATSCRILVWAHTEEVWAAACHPTLRRVVTGAWDRFIMLWDAESHRLIWRRDMKAGVQCVCFSADGARLAVGLLTGRWDMLDADSCEPLYTRTDGSDPIQTARFSPTGDLLALGSKNSVIYIYRIGDTGCQRLAKCSGHSSFITHLDWSSDSQLLRSSSGDYELLYWTAAAGQLVRQPSRLRDVSWSTHTCTLTFSAFGIYPEGVDGTDINTCWGCETSGLMVSGDDFGKVKLFRFPTCQPRSLHHVYTGHSGHVTHVEAFNQGTQVLSTGGNDMAAIQWTVV